MVTTLRITCRSRLELSGPYTPPPSPSDPRPYTKINATTRSVSSIAQLRAESRSPSSRTGFSYSVTRKAHVDWSPRGSGRADGRKDLPRRHRCLPSWARRSRKKSKKLTAQLPYGKVGRYENPSVRRSFTSVENRTRGPPRRAVVCKWDPPGRPMTARLRSLGILATGEGVLNKPYVAGGRDQATGPGDSTRGGARRSGGVNRVGTYVEGEPEFING
jgi:hypothetical protein